MSPTLIRAARETEFSPAAPVGAPKGEPVPHVRVAGHREIPVGGAGLWECTPGRFRRQIAEAEYSYILSGRGSFTPDGGHAIEFGAGDALYFAANTEGEWELLETVRKVYVIFP